MSIKYYANKVQETSITNGTGNMLLGGATSGHKTFVSSAINTNNKFTYYIYRLDSGLEWEIGIGYILENGGITQLVRETVLSSTNLDGLVSFSSGTKYIEPIIGEDGVNSSFTNSEIRSSNFTADYISAVYLIDASSSNVQVNLPSVASQTDPVILGFYLKNTIGGQYEQNNAINLIANGSETIDGNSSFSLDIIKDYIQIISSPVHSGWFILDPIQDATYPYGFDGSIQIKNNNAFSGVASFSWHNSSSSLLIGGTGLLTNADIILPINNQTVVFNEQSRDKDFRIEGSGTTHLLFVDASENRIGLNTSSVNDSLTINASNNNGITVYKSGIGPNITIGNLAASGLATNNTIGSISFSGLNSVNSPKIYSKIYSKIDSTISSAENSALLMQVLNNGTSDDVAIFSSSGISLGFNNQNTNGVLCGGASINNGNNIGIGYYNDSFGQNNIVIGNSMVASGNICGGIGHDHTSLGNNVWIIGGSGVSASGNNQTYLVNNANNHLAIVNSGSLAYTTMTNSDVNLSINNKTILSSGIKEYVSFNFTNNAGIAKTGLVIGADITSVLSGNENVSLYARSLNNGSQYNILNISSSNLNVGYNTTTNGNSVVYGTNNVSANSGNILYGTNIISSGNNNTIVGRNISCSGANISIFGHNNVCANSGNLGIVIMGNNNIANEDYAISIGDTNSSSGLYSVACGYNNGSHGDYSVSVGSNNSVLSKSSVAVGRNNNLNGTDLYATIFAAGIGNYASINQSGILVGYNNQLRGNGGLIVGNNSSSSGTNNIVVGTNSYASGNNILLFGNNISTTNSNQIYFNNQNINIVGSSGISMLSNSSGLSINPSNLSINTNISTTGNQINFNHQNINLSSISGTNLLVNNSGLFINQSGIIVNTKLAAQSGNFTKLSINDTNVISGTGTTNYLSKFVSTTGIGNGSIFDNGFIGIGTTNPQHKLDVVGNIAVSGSSGIYYYNAPTLVGPTNTLYLENNRIVLSSSSIKTKENITDYTKGLSDVLRLNPVSFNYIGGNRRTAGLIAEDLDSHNLEEFVVKNENNEPIDITYPQMIVLLINAIKELNNEINKLKNN